MLSIEYNLPTTSPGQRGILSILSKRESGDIKGKDGTFAETKLQSCKYLKKCELGMSKCVLKCSKLAKVPPIYTSLTVFSPFSVHILKASSVMEGANMLFPTKGVSMDILVKEKARLNCIHILRECLTTGYMQYVDMDSGKGILEQASACKDVCVQDARSSSNHLGPGSSTLEK